MKAVRYTEGDDLKLMIPISWNGYPFEIEVRTEWPEPILKCGWDGEACWGGLQLRDGYAVACWDTPGLRSGTLTGRLTYIIPDETMPDGERRSTVPIDMARSVDDSGVVGAVVPEVPSAGGDSQTTTPGSHTGTDQEWQEILAAINRKADASELTGLRSEYNAFVRRDAEFREDLADELNEIDDALGQKASKTEVNNALGDKLDKQQGVANAGKVMKVNQRGELEPAEEERRVKSVSVNGGTPVQPNAQGNVDLEIEVGGGSLEGLSVNGRAVNPDQEGNVDLEVVEGVKVNGNAVAIGQDGKVNLDVVEGLKLNGVEVQKDAEGKVNIEIDIPDTDNSLDPTSTNPIQNGAVAAAVAALQNPNFNSDVEEVEGGQQVTLSTMGGQQVAQFIVTGGGGGGDTSSSKILLSAAVSAAKVKEGGHSILSWYYNHVNSENQADGISGDVTVTVTRGAVTLHEETLTNVSPSEAAHQIVLDAWLTTAGNVGVTLRATANDNGTIQTKRYYIAVNVVALELTLNNSGTLIGKSVSGGYADGETITVGYTLKGSGTKEVSLYVDGSAVPQTQTVTRAGTTNGQFTLAATGLTAGRHVLQLVAENDGLMSESTYIDILKAGGNAPFIGLLFTSGDGTIFGAEDYLTPTMMATQYANSEFDFFIYDPASTTAQMTEWRGGIETQTFTVGRTRQTYNIRHTASGTISEWFVCGATEYQFYIQVAASSIEVSKATAGLVFELTATGRSNEESNPAQWVSGGVTTSFYGFDWKSSGWNNGVLVLRNGARLVIHYSTFDGSQDPAVNGKTIEMTFKVSNIIDPMADIISCMSGGKGFHITGSKASLLTGSSVTYNDEEGDQQTRVVGVEKTYAEDMEVKMAFVIGKRSEKRLMELYIDGTREKADIYNTTDNFVQDTPVGITIDSTAADIELRSVRVYDRALTDDEEVDNSIVDQRDPAEMLRMYNDNDVLENGEYDITKILAKGRGVVHFIRQHGLDEVNSANNKKTDFLTDIIYYSPFGREWDLKIEGCYVRIQGTSSTKYPCKNYRIYLLKPSSAKVYRRDANGNWVEDPNFTGYIFREGDREAPLICLKADYSDSSMTMNTGGAKLFDMLMRELGYLTPPQEVDPCVRQAIDGFPVDVFCTDTDDPNNAVKYYGQYNLNHDKGKSKNIFGHVKITDDEEVEHNFGASIALESLNNTNPLCLFQSAGSENSQALSDQLDADFDGGFEFNHPEDTVWSETPESGQTTATATQKSGIKRLFGWIYDCFMQTAGVQAGTMTAANPDYGTAAGWPGKAKWVCQKFKSELPQYFHVGHLLTYYAFTDYFMSVDQRAKNMMARTWDFLKWFITYYDGDCQLGKRNDSFLAYLYTLSRDTWDSDKSKYGFEGHDSWLWCLVLANFEEELKTAAKAMRNILTNDVVLRMLNEEQMGNWSARAYNKSGEFKYIIPSTDGVTLVQNGVTQTGVKYPFIYALDGTNYSHRVHTILHRFALLDAKYGCDTYKGDNVEMYLSRQAGDAAGTIGIRSNAPYFFDWNTKNGSHSDPQEAIAGGSVTLTFTGAITVNDPVDLYGASCMERIDLSGVAGSLQNGVNLNKATLLREINAASATARTQVWFFNFEQCKRLRLVDCTNHFGVKTGTSSSTEFDVSFATRLEVLRLGGTGVQSVEMAEGAPLTEVVLPSTLAVLKLRYLPLLTTAGLTIEGYNGITTLNFAHCPGLDWVALAGLCPNLSRLRVEGLSIEDDGTLLNRFKDLRGVDGDGNAVAKCQLVGDVWLTRYPTDSDIEEWESAYPSLNIHLPEYTMIEFDDTVSDPANISNLDNATGYKYGNDYVASGHISRILSQRHRCLGKMTGRGEMTYYPLHDKNSNYYDDAEETANCTSAALDGSEGDVMMYEPHYWYKGINDRLNGKKYACFCSKDTMPETPVATVLTWAELQAAGLVLNNYKVLTGKGSYVAAKASDSNYALVHVAVNGYSRVRFPSVPGNSFLGSVFTDADGTVVQDVLVETLSGGFEAGMYVIADVPSGATDLYFSVLKSAEFDKVVLSNSTRIEDMEPEWVEHEACMVAVAESTIVGSKLRSVMTSVASAGSMTWTDFNYYSGVRGMQQIDYEMHKDIANLFFAKYGTRDSQGQCGYGESSYSQPMNRTAALGMKDTVNPNGATTGSWYWNDAETPVLTSCGSVNALGYQNLFGDKTECMDGVAVNVGQVDGKYVIDMPDGTQRKVKSKTTSGEYIKAVAHGKYMDVIAVAASAGTSTTYYCDINYYTASVARVVYRSSHNASPYGGVSYASASSDAAYSNAALGSRLAFRGTLVKAASVAAFKAATEVS